MSAHLAKAPAVCDEDQDPGYLHPRPLVEGPHQRLHQDLAGDLTLLEFSHVGLYT